MIPEGWACVTIRNVVERVTTGVSVNSEGRPRAAGELGVLKTSAVTYGVFRAEENKVVAPEDLARAREHPRAGCVLFSRMNTIGLVGASAYVAADREDLVLPDRIWQLQPSANADGRWLHATLSSPAMRARLSEAASGTSGSMKNLSQEKLLRLPVMAPPLPEQRKIAAIVACVDDAIESTQAVIDQLGIVKKAMMAELLTRGLPGRHTRFKQTEIGEVPEAWEVELLDAVARRGSGHTPNKSHLEYWGGEIKWVSLQDSRRLDRLYIDDTTAKITPLGIANSSATEHPAGTVVLSRDAGVGKSAITTDVMAVSQHFMAWICGPRLNNHYLYYWLQQMKPTFERIAIGNTIKTIGLPYFKKLRLAVPLLDEQKTIAASLTSADARLFSEERCRNQLGALKSALMSVLLTGEVRVKPDEDAA